MFDKEKKEFMSNIYTRCLFLNIRPQYENYYFRIIDERVVLKGFIDETLIQDKLLKEENLIIEDYFDSCDLSFEYQGFGLKEQLGSFIKPTHTKFIKISVGDSLDTILDFDFMTPYRFSFYGKNVETVKSYSFSKTFLYQIVLPKLKYMENCVFQDCLYLEYVKCKNCEHIEPYAFHGCDRLLQENIIIKGSDQSLFLRGN